MRHSASQESNSGNKQTKRSFIGRRGSHAESVESQGSAASTALRNALMQHNEEKVGIIKARRLSALRGKSSNARTRSNSHDRTHNPESPADSGARIPTDLAAGNFRKLLGKMPANSYNECDTKDTPISSNVVSPNTNPLMVDIFLNDFFFLRDDRKGGQYLLYIYVPICSQLLDLRIAETHDAMAASNAGVEHMKYVGAAENIFTEEDQGIRDSNQHQVIRVAFKMKDGRMDDYCRAILSEYPILSLPANEEWPLIRCLMISAQPVKNECFMKRGNLSPQEVKFVNSGFPPAGSALWFLDRGEQSRTAVIAAESGGQVRINTCKIVANKRRSGSMDNLPERRCVVNGRIVLRLASNPTPNPRRLLPSSNELDKMKRDGIDFLEEAFHRHQRINKASI